MNVRRGDVVLVHYPFASGQGGSQRPALIVQNDRDNERLRNTIVAQMTTNLRRAADPSHLLKLYVRNEGATMTPEQTENATASFPNTMGLRDAWSTLAPAARLAHFRRLPWTEAEAFFLELAVHDQVEIIHGLPLTERRLWLRVLAPDDTADVIQEAPAVRSTRCC